MKNTKTMDVLEHLRTGNTITQNEACMLYGVSRLTDIIYDLRNRYGCGSIISDKVEFTDRYGRKGYYVRYSWNENNT